MKMITLDREVFDLPALLRMARQEPVLLITAEGEEFLLAEADDFAREVEELRASVSFQHFLEKRASDPDSVPLDLLEQLLDAELGNEGLDVAAASPLYATAVFNESQAEYRTGQ